jgi:hypothetical protein
VDQLRATGVAERLGEASIYASDDRVGVVTARATADAEEWVRDQPAP